MLKNIRDAFINHTEAMIGSSVRHSKPFQTMVHLLDIVSVMFTPYNFGVYTISSVFNCKYTISYKW